MNNLAGVYERRGQVRAGRGAPQSDPGDSSAACWSRASRDTAASMTNLAYDYERRASTRRPRRSSGDPGACEARASRNAGCPWTIWPTTTLEGKYAQAEALSAEPGDQAPRVGSRAPLHSFSYCRICVGMYQREGQIRLGGQKYAAQALAGRGTPWARNTRTRWPRRPIWRWPTFRRGSLRRAEPLAREAMETDEEAAG